MSTTDTQEKEGKAPPTMSPVTLYNFVDLHRRTLPNRIDKSMMTTIAGGDQPRILGALRHLWLVEGPQDKPSAHFVQLREAADDQDAVKAAWSSILRQAYPVAFEKLNLSIATQGEIDEVFRETYNISGETVRKSVAFFLALCRNAGIPLSSYVKKTRTRTPGSNMGKPKTPRARRNQTPGTDTPTPPAPGAAPVKTPSGTSAMVVHFKSGGTATLFVDADWVTISTEDRKSLLAWIDAMKRYAAKYPAPTTAPPPPTASDDEAQANT